MTLRELFKAIAEAIRYVDGTTAEIIPTTYPERIKALSGGGGGGNGSANVVNVPVNISARVSVTAEKYYLFMLYNGVRLPRIPESVLASYPYAFIVKDLSSGAYRIYAGQAKAYFNVQSGVNRLDIPASSRCRYDYSNDAWSLVNTYTTSTYFNMANFEMVWSNFDIPNGSATATDIYFEGTDPVPTD